MENETLYMRAVEAWNAMAAFRADRERNKRYAFGSQWDDIIEADGVKMTEAEYIRSQGSVPLKNNLIRRLVRNVLGVWRQDFAIPKARPRDQAESAAATLLNKLLLANADTNRLTELYARTMEEFLISGVAVHRKSYGPVRGTPDCRTDYVNPANFFFTSGSCDFRGWDVELIGQLHDIPFNRLAMQTGCDPTRLEKLASSFGLPNGASDAKVRVVEVWREEPVAFLTFHDRARGCLVSAPEASFTSHPVDARREWKLIWKYSFLGPRGEVLAEGCSPYSHGLHPYVFKVYPYVDGEVHSFVADVIDQQRHTNRLITLYDWVMRSTAKGVLLFPEGSLPDGCELDDVADQWGRFNGVIPYRAKPGVPVPQQVSSTAQCGGIADLLDIQLKMLEDISGVNPALQGKLESAGVSGTLFSQQTRNAMISLRDILESYREFVLEATRRDACNLMHFYTPGRMAEVAGGDADLRMVDMSHYSAACSDFTFSS